MAKQLIAHKKFIHIIYHPDLKFIPKFVERINTHPDYFDANDHLFVTKHKVIFDALKGFDNVELYSEKENPINKYGAYCDNLILHALPDKKMEIIKSKNKYLKKVIWRTWGHDAVKPNFDCGFIKGILKRIYWRAFSKKIKKFKMVAVANAIDEYAIKELFGKMKTCSLYYGANADDNLLPRLEEIAKSISSKPQKPYRILGSHSGSPTDNHIEVLDAFSNFRTENIKMCLILSYGGTKEYYDKVVEYGKQIYGEKLEIISEKKSYFDYASYIANVDLMVLNQKHSAGLGNFSLARHFSKPVVVNEQSPFAGLFKENGFEYYTLDKINTLTFEQLCQIKLSDQIKNFFPPIYDGEQVLEITKELFNSL